jgi:hypothetical protein
MKWQAAISGRKFSRGASRLLQSRMMGAPALLNAISPVCDGNNVNVIEIAKRAVIKSISKAALAVWFKLADNKHCLEQYVIVLSYWMYFVDRIALIAEYQAYVEHYNRLVKQASDGRTLSLAISMDSARHRCDQARLAIDRHRRERRPLD